MTTTEPTNSMSTPRRRLALAALSAILLAALAVIVVGQLWLHGQRTDDHRRAEVASAAKHAVATVLSYDYRRLPEGLKETDPLLTGDARSQYDALQKPLATTAPPIKAVVRGEVKATTVLSADQDSARVLLFVDQTSISTKVKQPQLDQSRIVVGLVHRHGKWLVSTLSAV